MFLRSRERGYFTLVSRCCNGGLWTLWVLAGSYLSDASGSSSDYGLDHF